jgi:hypothetical protein
VKILYKEGGMRVGQNWVRAKRPINVGQAAVAMMIQYLFISLFALQYLAFIARRETG